MGIENRNTKFVNLFGDPDRPIYGNELVVPASPSPTPSATLTPTPTTTPSPTLTPTPTPSATPPPPFNPSDLSGLTIWYDFDDTSEMTYDGSNIVSAVNDKSGNNYDLTASVGHRPLLTTDTTYGGNNCLEFSGGTSSATRQALTHSLSTMRTGLTANTMFIVMRMERDETLAQENPYQITTNSGDRIWGQYFRSTNVFRASYPGGQFNNYTGFSSEYPYVLLYQTQETGSPYATITSELNGLTPSSIISDAYDLPQFDWISIGARTEFGGYADAMKGNFGEFIFYDRKLTPSEIVQVVNYLEDKWNYVAW